MGCLIMAMCIFNLSIFGGTPLRTGTMVPVRLNSAATSKSERGPEAIVDKDVYTKDGKLAIRAGAPVEVLYTSRKPQSIGEQGYLSLRFTSTVSVDGRRVSLDSKVIEEEGESKSGKAIGLGVGLGIFVWPLLACLCIKGGHATIPAGTVYTNVFTSYDVEIDE